MSTTSTDIEQQRRRLGGLRGELLLVVPPTVVVLLTMVLLEALRHERILFASLAASAFLIYRDPAHPMNGVRVMVLAHSVAVVTGVSSEALLGPGYPAAALAMIVTVLVLVLCHCVHPPAVATALGFAFLPNPSRPSGYLRSSSAWWPSWSSCNAPRSGRCAAAKRSPDRRRIPIPERGGRRSCRPTPRAPFVPSRRIYTIGLIQRISAFSAPLW